MKNLILLGLVGIFTLSSFSVVPAKKVIVTKGYWTAMCADGSVGGYFACDCSQAQANKIATIMCN